MIDRKIGSRQKAINPITRRKRVFLFMANKVTVLYRTGDDVALLAMTKEGVVQYIFTGYMLDTQHTGEALMNQIYKHTFITKIGLTPAEIMA